MGSKFKPKPKTSPSSNLLLPPRLASARSPPPRGGSGDATTSEKTPENGNRHPSSSRRIRVLRRPLNPGCAERGNRGHLAVRARDSRCSFSSSCMATVLRGMPQPWSASKARPTVGQSLTALPIRRASSQWRPREGRNMPSTAKKRRTAEMAKAACMRGSLAEQPTRKPSEKQQKNNPNPQKAQLLGWGEGGGGSTPPFVTPHEIYCYKVMSFGLKNVGATYQRLMTKIFKPLIGQTVEVYIDDIVVKSKTKTSAIRWTNECETTFEKIKRYLTQPPILSSLQFSEQLYMYLAVSDCAISVILFRCVNDKEQRSVYYVSKAMVNTKTRYSNMEYTTFALRSVARKLYHYFQAHQVIVLTNPSLRNIMHKPDLFGRLVRWAIELSEYGIKYQPRLAMKGHVMANFIAETPQKPHQGVSGSRMGLLLQSSTGEQLEQAIRLGFLAFNNEAKYEAILTRLSLALTLSTENMKSRMNEWSLSFYPVACDRLVEIFVQASFPIHWRGTLHSQGMLLHRFAWSSFANFLAVGYEEGPMRTPEYATRRFLP
uniref:Reverse transcriptase/retrotransposon-derived protein RNase H-like domain-containing protein n=1 Tax=Vitis vinifera TaxID=29760 RepID=A5B8F8_VITVI|nr:hypothetical protein VITISV_012644 [Vitis vinifera]